MGALRCDGRHARWEAARLRPAVTVVFLGTTDNYDMRGPDGSLLRRCGTQWVDEYARRATAPGSAIVAVDRLVSPGFRFQSFATVGARRVRLRAEDGIHLSLQGSRLAAQAVLRAVRAG